MQRLEFFRARCMDIPKNEHVFKTIFAPILVAAAPFEFFWIPKGAKQHIPNGDVREVVGMVLKLMMDSM